MNLIFSELCFVFNSSKLIRIHNKREGDIYIFVCNLSSEYLRKLAKWKVVIRSLSWIEICLPICLRLWLGTY